jgi:hypothetical protein
MSFESWSLPDLCLWAVLSLYVLLIAADYFRPGADLRLGAVLAPLRALAFASAERVGIASETSAARVTTSKSRPSAQPTSS